MKIITLIENSSHAPSLGAEHGLSIYIEGDSGKKILFDTGKSTLFAENAISLRIDLTEIDLAVISHGHYDHLGGLLHFLKINKQAKVVMKKEIFSHQYQSIRGENIRNIGYPEELRQYKDRFIFLSEIYTRQDELIFITAIRQDYQLPKGNAPLFRIDAGGNKWPDDFRHELIFAIEGKAGLVLFTGCAHNGILNMLTTLKHHLPDKKIAMIHGGLHLTDDSDLLKTETTEELHNTALEIQKLAGESIICTGHCTGQKAMSELGKSLGKNFQTLHSGHIITI